jgi:hypothetical protein
MQTRGNDARVVQHEDIARPEKFQNILKPPVRDAMLGAIQDEQPGLVAQWRRSLGNELRRQIKTKISGSHGRQRNGSQWRLTIHDCANGL